jgi:phospholipid transport system transporter-binding protein
MADAGYTDQGDGHWLVSGELGYATVPGLLASAGRSMQGEGAIEVDLAGVTRADSAGLALLIEWTAASERAGRKIHFIHVPAQLLSIARVCGLEEILPLAD